MSSQNIGYNQEGGSKSDMLLILDTSRMSHNSAKLYGGRTSAFPTNTEFPSIKTVTLNHIYREQKSVELQSKRARSKTIKKGARKKGVHAPTSGSNEHETIMRGQKTFNKFRVTT